MLTFTTAMLLVAIIITALYAFGVFNTPYLDLDAFRSAFYLLLVLLVLAVWFGVIEHPTEVTHQPTTADNSGR
jgi:hypothetical protein